jgi:hypothetical protein
MTIFGRLGAFALGLICAGLGCYGAYEFAYRLEGSVTYLVLAAPVIAGTAALIPPIAEATWRAGGYVKALLWWAVLVPAGAVVFYSAAERVHDAKAGAEADRGALCVFRRSRPWIPSEGGHPFQSKPARDSDDPGHQLGLALVSAFSSVHLVGAASSF